MRAHGILNAGDLFRGRRYHDDFYAVDKTDGKQSIFDYCPSTQGLSQGLWLPGTAELFEKEGIQVDVSLRGITHCVPKPGFKKRNYVKTSWNIFRSLRP